MLEFISEKPSPEKLWKAITKEKKIKTINEYTKQQLQFLIFLKLSLSEDFKASKTDLGNSLETRQPLEILHSLAIELTKFGLSIGDIYQRTKTSIQHNYIYNEEGLALVGNTLRELLYGTIYDFSLLKKIYGTTNDLILDHIFIDTNPNSKELTYWKYLKGHYTFLDTFKPMGSSNTMTVVSKEEFVNHVDYEVKDHIDMTNNKYINEIILLPTFVLKDKPDTTPNNTSSTSQSERVWKVGDYVRYTEDNNQPLGLRTYGNIYRITEIKETVNITDDRNMTTRALTTDKKIEEYFTYVESDEDGWITHTPNGNKPPLNDNIFIEVKLADGTKNTSNSASEVKKWDWASDLGGNGIVAYRIPLEGESND